MTRGMFARMNKMYLVTVAIIEVTAVSVNGNVL